MCILSCRHCGFNQFNKIGTTIWNGFVVEVIFRMMESCGVAIAEEDESAWLFFQIVSKVFAAHGRFDILVHLIRVACDFRCNLSCELGLFWMV